MIFKFKISQIYKKKLGKQMSLSVRHFSMPLSHSTPHPLSCISELVRLLTNFLTVISPYLSKKHVKLNIHFNYPIYILKSEYYMHFLVLKSYESSIFFELTTYTKNDYKH